MKRRGHRATLTLVTRQRLSSSYTLLYKRLFPALNIGLPILWMLLFYWNVTPEVWRESGQMAFGVACVIFLNGLFMSHKFAREPVEGVWMEGETLIVRNKGKEERLPMQQIRKMTPSQYLNPRRLTIELFSPCAFGEQIIFLLPGKKDRPALEEFVQRLNRVHQVAAASEVPPAPPSEEP